MPPKPSPTPSTQVTPSGPPHDLDPMLMWNSSRISETLVQDDDIHCPPLQLIRVYPPQDSQQTFTLPPWVPQRTHYEITWQQYPADMGTPAPSEYRESDELLSPIHLQRTLDHSVPMRLSPAHFPQFKGVAASPVSSTVKLRFDGVTGKFFQGDDLHECQQLSPISSYHSFDPLPTPDFDSTGHVIGLAQRGENLEDFNEHQVDFADPALSQTLHDAWCTQMQTPPTFQSVPGSAPPALYRSTAEQRELEAQAKLDDNADFPVVELVASQDDMP